LHSNETQYIPFNLLLVLTQDEVNCGPACHASVCKMNIVFKNLVSDIPQGDGIFFQYHIDYGGLLLICEFLAFATSC